ncbi:MAG: C69 family dipeptidase, partial [Oscillospiraceae bacterium]
MKKQFKLLSVILATTMLLGSVSAMACTASYVGKDVSTDGTTIIARSEDQGQGDYNKMYVVVPRVDNVPGRFMEDTGNGFKLPLPATTYKYTMVPDYTQGDDGTYPGICTNEYGVTISGTVSASPCEAWENADPYIEPALREAILPAAVAAVSKTAREALDVLM